mmetsp:Transcript_75918/g.212837  ORF Transcript_75918/g.212837 Transcript_75918/m.212837 type:complete len:375 (+) Transcript_75918:977-2101(+)
MRLREAPEIVKDRVRVRSRLLELFGPETLASAVLGVVVHLIFLPGRKVRAEHLIIGDLVPVVGVPLVAGMQEEAHVPEELRLARADVVVVANHFLACLKVPRGHPTIQAAPVAPLDLDLVDVDLLLAASVADVRKGHAQQHLRAARHERIGVDVDLGYDLVKVGVVERHRAAARVPRVRLVARPEARGLVDPIGVGLRRQEPLGQVRRVILPELIFADERLQHQCPQRRLVPALFRHEQRHPLPRGARLIGQRPAPAPRHEVLRGVREQAGVRLAIEALPLLDGADHAQASQPHAVTPHEVTEEDVLRALRAAFLHCFAQRRHPRGLLRRRERGPRGGCGQGSQGDEGDPGAGARHGVDSEALAVAPTRLHDPL